MALKLFHEARERNSEDDITIVLVRIALEPTVPCGTPASMSPAPGRASHYNDDDDVNDDDVNDIIPETPPLATSDSNEDNNDDNPLNNTLVGPSALTAFKAATLN